MRKRVQTWRKSLQNLGSTISLQRLCKEKKFVELQEETRCRVQTKRKNCRVRLDNETKFEKQLLEFMQRKKFVELREKMFRVQTPKKVCRMQTWRKKKFIKILGREKSFVASRHRKQNCRVQKKKWQRINGLQSLDREKKKTRVQAIKARRNYPLCAQLTFDSHGFVLV